MEKREKYHFLPVVSRFEKKISLKLILQREMEKMVHGHSKVPKPKRHANAMKERERKNFHYEFTTLRFHSIAEHGEWKGT